MPKLIELLENKSNDYIELEQTFRRKFKKDLINGSIGQSFSTDKKFINNSYSVIVPSYRFPTYLNGLLISLDNQSYKKKFEVIVVNNKFKTGTPLDNIYKPNNYRLKFIDLSINYGRAFARNVGLAYSTGSIISFVDSDMILPYNFIQEHFSRVALFNNILITGLYQNIRPSSYKKLIKYLIKKRFRFKASYKHDFRYEKVFTKLDKRINYNLSYNDIAKKFTILKATKNFKEFGFNRKYGVWTLPWMVLTISMTLSRKYATMIGGFDTRFKGWGFEDTHFGAKFIGSGGYILPIKNCVAYRVKHRPRNGSEQAKNLEARKNFNRFKKFLNEELNTSKLSSIFKDKFSEERLKTAGLIKSEVIIN
ncbi:MAG: glycosyltransferase family 2 protein [Candidatus Micrarchaeaceae archaeon]